MFDLSCAFAASQGSGIGGTPAAAPPGQSRGSGVAVSGGSVAGAGGGGGGGGGAAGGAPGGARVAGGGASGGGARPLGDDGTFAVPASRDALNREEFWKMRQQFDRTKKEVPACVALCVRYLEQQDELANSNIFEEPCDTPIVLKAKAAFDAGNDQVDVARIGSHNVATLLWLWFRELFEPLLTYELYAAFVEDPVGFLREKMEEETGREIEDEEG